MAVEVDRDQTEGFSIVFKSVVFKKKVFSKATDPFPQTQLDIECQHVKQVKVSYFLTEARALLYGLLLGFHGKQFEDH